MISITILVNLRILVIINSLRNICLTIPVCSVFCYSGVRSVIQTSTVSLHSFIEILLAYTYVHSAAELIIACTLAVNLGIYLFEQNLHCLIAFSIFYLHIIINTTLQIKNIIEIINLYWNSMFFDYLVLFMNYFNMLISKILIIPYFTFYFIFTNQTFVFKLRYFVRKNIIYYLYIRRGLCTITLISLRGLRNITYSTLLIIQGMNYVKFLCKIYYQHKHIFALGFVQNRYDKKCIQYKIYLSTYMHFLSNRQRKLYTDILLRKYYVLGIYTQLISGIIYILSHPTCRHYLPILFIDIFIFNRKIHNFIIRNDKLVYVVIVLSSKSVQTLLLQYFCYLFLIYHFLVYMYISNLIIYISLLCKQFVYTFCSYASRVILFCNIRIPLHLIAMFFNFLIYFRCYIIILYMLILNSLSQSKIFIIMYFFRYVIIYVKNGYQGY